MDCLVEFLSEAYQQNLRKLSQSQAENYEEALNIYEKIFISHLKALINELEKCEKARECVNKEECDEIKKIVESIGTKEITCFFDKIKEIYINWIDGKWSSSLEEFSELMETHNILSFYADDLTKGVLFRGRLSSSILTNWDMYHIPFNKRYLIGNQRYSLTGQPMIYLGNSVIDIVEELEVEPKELINLNVSTFQIENELRVYDLRNNIYRDINENYADGVLIENIDIKTYFDKSKFYRNLLSSMCSFERRKEHKGFSFCEEYVLPQILAQTLKHKGFDGIAYFSTKKFKSVKFNSDNKKLESIRTKYKENIAMFTNFTAEHVYDRDLYNKMTISKPIDINKVEEIDLKMLEYIIEKIDKTGDQKQISQASLIFSKLKREFEDCYVEEKKYYETSIGKLHIYHIYIILNNIFSNCKKEVK